MKQKSLRSWASPQKAFYIETGSKLRGLRLRKGATQEWVGSQIGVGRATVANIESGRQTISLYQYHVITKALQGVSPILNEEPTVRIVALDKKLRPAVMKAISSLQNLLELEY